MINQVLRAEVSLGSPPELELLSHQTEIMSRAGGRTLDFLIKKENQFRSLIGLCKVEEGERC